jgi:hypothetical protein
LNKQINKSTKSKERKSKMKKLGMFLMLVVAMAVAMPTSYAQLSKKEIKKIEKTAKKEAKQLKKYGWKVAPGNPSMEMQLTESFKYQMQKDDEGYDKFIQGEAMTVGQVYDAALFQADNLSKLNLAGKMETRVIQIIDNKLANKEISKEDAVSLVTSISASKNLISQRLGQVITPVKMYRDLPNGNVEVRIIAYYSQTMANKVAKAAMREDLEKEANDLSNRLDDILGN